MGLFGGNNETENRHYVVTLASWAVATSILSTWISSSVPNIIMDEEFHVRQTQFYCNGKFSSWDGKTTTFPGLFILGSVYAAILSPLTAAACDVVLLRTLNLFFSLGVLAVVLQILQHTQPNIESRHRCLLAVTICLFPPYFFSTFLYYTDAGGLFFVLVAFLMAFKKNWAASAVASLAGVAFRQTNIIWCIFAAAVASIQEYKQDNKLDPYANDMVEVVSHLTGHLVRNHPLRPVLGPVLQRFRKVMLKSLGHGSIVVAFITFVWMNKGIALGDKEAHPLSLHLMQLPYFALVTTAFFFYILNVPDRFKTLYDDFCHRTNVMDKITNNRKCRNLRLAVILITVAIGFCVHHATLVHPYMLADNRHYTFYIWKNIMGRSEVVRLALAPVYTVCGWLMVNGVIDEWGHLWASTFFGGLTAALILVWLIEFRYFIVGAVLLAVQVKAAPEEVVTRNVVVLAVINLLTLLVFVCWPFVGPDGAQSRFMW